MAKAKKVGEGRWVYRGGTIDHFDGPPRRIGNWNWNVCGVGGWARTKWEAVEAVDSILEQARAILAAEERSPVRGKGGT